MPQNKTEQLHANEAIFSAPWPNVMNETGILASGQNLGAMRALGRVTVGGKLVAWNPGASDGSQTIVGFLRRAVDATSGDTKVVYIARFVELNNSELDWGTATTNQINAARAALAASPNFVFVRDAI